MEINYKETDGVVIISFDEDSELKDKNLIFLKKVLNDLSINNDRLVINIMSIKFISIEAVAVFVRFQTYLKGRGGVLKFFGLNGQPKDVFKTTNIDQIFDVFETEKETLDSFL